MAKKRPTKKRSKGVTAPHCAAAGTLLQHALCRSKYAAYRIRYWFLPEAKSLLKEAMDSAKEAVTHINGAVKKEVLQAIVKLKQAEKETVIPKKRQPYIREVYVKAEATARSAFAHLEKAQILAMKTCHVPIISGNVSRLMKCDVAMEHETWPGWGPSKEDLQAQVEREEKIKDNARIAAEAKEFDRIQAERVAKAKEDELIASQQFDEHIKSMTREEGSAISPHRVYPK